MRLHKRLGADLGRRFLRSMLVESLSLTTLTYARLAGLSDDGSGVPFAR